MVEKKTNGQKIHEYVYNVKPVLNKGGLFADGSKYYVSPQEPDADQDVKVRFRTTADNVDEVFLIYNEEKVQMTKESSNRIFDFYNATIPGGLPFIRYHFEIHSGRVHASMTNWDLRSRTTESTTLRYVRDSRYRSGQRARYSTRYLWTGSATAICPTMCWTMSMRI